MPTRKAPSKKPARIQPRPRGMDIHTRLTEALAEEVRAIAAAEKVDINKWMVAAAQAAVSAHFEQRSVGRLDQIFEKLNDLAVLKRRQEDLHALVRGVEKSQKEELGQAFHRVGEALVAIDRRTETLETVLQGQRLLIAALVLGSTEYTRQALNRIMTDSGNLGQMVSDWRNGR